MPSIEKRPGRGRGEVRPWRARLARVARAIAWCLVAGAALGALVLAALQVDGIGTRAGRWTLGAAAPDGVRVEAETVTGSWVRGVAITGLRVEDPRSDLVVAVDSLRLLWHPLRWRRRSLRLDSVVVAGLALEASPEVLRRDGRGEASPGGLSVGALVLRDVRAVVEDGEGRVFRLGSGAIRVDSLRLGSGGPRGSWALSGTFGPPGEGGERGRIESAGSLSPAAVRLDTLRWISPRSRVEGSARIALDLPPGAPGGVVWNLEAAPLALADLRGLVDLPAVVAGESLTVTTSAREMGDSARVRVAGRSSGGARVDLDVVWNRTGDAWTVRARGDAEGLDPRRYLGGGAPRGPLTARLRGDGSIRRAEGRIAEGRFEADVDVDAPELGGGGRVRLVRAPGPDGGARDSVELRTGPLSWRGVALASARLGAVVEARRARWEADLDVAGGGRVEGGGEIEGPGSGGPRTWRLGLALDSVAHPATGSLLDGRITGEGSGLAGEDHRALVRAVLRPSRLAGWPTRRADLTAEWQGGAGTLRGDVAWDANPRAPPGELRGALGWTGPPARMLEPRALAGELVARTGPTRLGPVFLEAGTARLRVDRGELEGRLGARLPGGGTFEGAVVGRVSDSVAVALRDGAFTGLLLARRADGSHVASLNGTASGQWLRPPDRRGSGSAVVTLAPSGLGVDSVRGGSARLTVEPDTVHGVVELALGGGRLSVSVSGRPGPGRWDVEAVAAVPALGRMFGRAPEDVGFHGRMAFRGDPSGRDGAWLVHADSAKGWSVRMAPGLARGRLEDGLLRVDSLGVRTAALEVRAAGALPVAALGLTGPASPEPARSAGEAAHRFTLEARVPDDSTSGPWTPSARAGAGGLRATASCRGARCVVEARAAFDTVRAGGWEADAARLEVAGTWSGEPGRSELDGSLEAGGIRLPRGGVRTARVDVVLRDGLWTVDAAAAVDDDRDASARLTVSRADSAARVALGALRVRMDRDEWALSRPAALRIAPGRLDLDTLVVASTRGRLQLDGIWSTARKDVGVQVDSLWVGAFSDFVGAPGLGGWIDGRLDVVAGPGGRPALEGRATGSLAHGGAPLHDFGVAVRSAGGILSLDGGLTDARGRPRLTLLGDVPGSVPGGGAWHLDVEADSLPLAWATPWLPAPVVTNLAGAAHGRLEIRGDRDAPTVVGPWEVRGGTVDLPAAGISLDGLSLAAEGEGRRVRIDSLAARSRGEGTVRLAGSVGLPGPDEPADLDLDVATRGFLAADTRLVRAVLSGGGRLTGTRLAPRFAGAFEVVAGDLYLDALLPDEAAPVTLTSRDWDVLRRRFGVVPPDEEDPGLLVPDALVLDVALALDRDLWLRQEVDPRMAVQFTGDLRVRRPAPRAELQVEGRLEAIPGRSFVEQLARRFDVEAGTVEFVGPLAETRIDVTSAYEVPAPGGGAGNVVVRLNLAGTGDDFGLTLSSEPAMENADMVSYLATGRPANEAFGAGSGSAAADLGAGVVGRELGRVMERYARENAGLDVVEIRQEGLQGASFVVGKYLTPRFFLGFRQPVSFRGREGGSTRVVTADVEYRAFRWLLAQLQAGGLGYRLLLEASRGY